MLVGQVVWFSCHQLRKRQRFAVDRGLQAAKGDQVVFMHVDTRLPDRWEDAMLRCLKDPRVVGGAFFKRFDHPHWLMRGSRIRCLLMMNAEGRAFGDQCLFARRDILMASGESASSAIDGRSGHVPATQAAWRPGSGRCLCHDLYQDASVSAVSCAPTV